MCIAIVKPENELLTVEGLNRCWDNNPDGGGVAYAENGRIVVFKTMDKAEWVDYILSNMERELVVHARYTTRGVSNKLNCHPYTSGKDSVCFMNGTMPQLPEEKIRSDTRIFAEDIVSRLPHGWQDNSAMSELVRQYAGDAKLIFMFESGRIDILNEDLGNWHNGCWFSNQWYVEDRYETYSVGSGFQKQDGDWFFSEEECALCQAPLMHHELEDMTCEDCIESEIDLLTSKGFHELTDEELEMLDEMEMHHDRF